MLEDGVGWLDEKFKESEEMVGWGSIGSLRTEWVQGSGEKHWGCYVIQRYRSS